MKREDQSTKRKPKATSRMPLAEQLVNLPRTTRVLTVAFFSIMTTLAMTPVVDEIYLRFFLDAETVAIPALISVAGGLIMYAAGWYLVVGTVGEEHNTQRLTSIYVAMGLLATGLVGLWIVRLLLIGRASLA